MATEILTEIPPVVHKAMTRIGDIATLPEVTVKIINLVEDPRSTARDLHDVIKTDPALSARLLKVVNSAFYGLPGQVATVDRAIVLLGLSTVKNIAIAASIGRLFTGARLSESYTARDVWRHSVGVAVLSRQLYKHVFPGQPDADEAFLAGLIHDLGLLVERQAFPDELVQVVDRATTAGGSFCDIEEEILGANHQQFGSALAGKWKFPPRLRTILGYHHGVDVLAPEHRPMTNLIHVADIAVAQAEIGFPLTADRSVAVEELLPSLNISAELFAEIREALPDHVESAEATLTE